MKTFLVALSMAVAGLSLAGAPLDAEAKRIGGGKSVGMQRQASPQPTQSPQTPPTQAQPAAAAAPAAAGAAAAAGKRSWLGPIAGIAAGLGLAALMSHLGLGEGMANILTLMLLAGAAFFLIRFLMRRFAGGASRGAPSGLQFAGAGAASGSAAGFGAAPAQPLQRSGLDAAAPVGGIQLGKSGSAASFDSADFDAAGFERVAKTLFIRLQAANDAGEVEDLRKFTTPELFASLRLDLQDRKGASQQTDVLQLDAQVLDRARDDGQWVVSVRFHGLIREQADAAAERFDEVWHFVRPLDESRDWAIAGITQVS
ncbi:Tim44-like domain-containing protein [Aquabacterium sp. A7-Y]|nr:Tim44-like domain-containing protein [Aquabacterium sp. A7-Y]